MKVEETSTGSKFFNKFDVACGNVFLKRYINLWAYTKDVHVYGGYKAFTAMHKYMYILYIGYRYEKMNIILNDFCGVKEVTMKRIWTLCAGN